MALDERIKFLQASIRFGNETTAKKYIERLLDPGTFFEINALAKSKEKYTGVITGFGKINGNGVYVFAQENKLKKGAMTTPQIEKICKVLDLAQTTGSPIVGIFDSCGGQLDDEYKLMQSFSTLMKKFSDLSGVIPQIAIISGVCLGMSALIASKADFVVTTENSNFSIETANSTANVNYIKSGVSHIDTKNMDQALLSVKQLLSMLPINNLSMASPGEFSENNNQAYFDMVSNNLMNGNNKMNHSKFLESISDDNTCVEIQKGYGESISLALSKIKGETVGLVLMHGGEIDSESSSKTARFVRFCDAFSIPVITFVNGEKFASLKDASKLSCAYCEATTTKISVIIGQAFGSVFSTTCVEGAACDISIAWVNSSICIMNPKTAAILFHEDELKNSNDPINDRKELIRKYIDSNTAPFKSAQRGLIHNIIVASDTRDQICNALEMLRSKRASCPPKKHSNIQI